jgi:translocation and assembly module TamB
VKAVRWWLLGGLSLLLLVVIVGASTVWWAVATESGTRWLLGQIFDSVPEEIEVRELSGTLWHGVRLEHVAYLDAERRVELSGLDLEVGWSGTSLNQVAISRFSTERLTIVSLAASAPEPEPLDLDFAPLPIRISVQTIDIGLAEIDGVVASDITIRDLDVDSLNAKVASAAATVDVYNIQLAGLEVELRDDVPLSTGFSWRATDSNWAGAGELDGSLRGVELTHDLYGEYPMRSTGTVDLSEPAGPTIDVVSSFEEWRYEDWVATDGTVRLRGAVKDYQSDLAVSVTDGGLMSAQVRGEVRGNESGLTAVDLTADIFDGSARVSGSVLWSPALSADLIVAGTDMDLSSLTGGFTTNLDWDLRVAAAGTENFSMEIRRLAGSYNDQPVLASGTVSRDGALWRCQGCDAAIGNNLLMADMSLTNRRLNGAIDIDAPSLQQLHPEVAGALKAAGTLSGSIDLPTLSGDLAARELGVQGWSIAALTIDTRSVTTESVDVVIELDGLANDGLLLGGGNFQITGPLDQLNVESQWSTGDIHVEYAAILTRNDDVITGRLSSGLVEQSDTGKWVLAEPVNFIATPAGVTVDNALWSNGDTRLAIDRIASGADSLAVDIELIAAPLHWLDMRTPSEVTFDGFVDAVLSLQQNAGDWSGQFKWQQRQTVLHIDDGDGDPFAIAVTIAEAEASLGAAGATLRARLEADGDTKVDLDAKASDLSREATIGARLTASGHEWDWLSAFVPGIEEVVGSVQVDFKASGRVVDPQVNGELRLTNGALVLPAFNVPITDINGRVSGNSSGALTVSGEARAGNGNLFFAGTITDLISKEPRLAIEVRGDDATVLDWPDYALVVSPDLSLSGQGDQYKIAGRVRLDQAEILVRELPEGAVSPSDDVSVVGREDTGGRTTQLTGEFDLELADSVHVRAFGLDTKLEGELRIALPVDRDPRANGELSLVGGFFELYGQRLDIERGTMLFSGALDNPFVDVRVVRSIDSVEGTIKVGADIAGRADALTSTLYSEPAMSEAEVLSFLVTGRSLNQAGSASGKLMSDAAFSLGLAQAAVITNQIGQAVGLDELALEGSNQDATQLVAGKQISSNLYARYRYGVFSSLGELLLRYSLTESLSVELGTGEFQSIDIQYEIERE